MAKTQTILIRNREERMDAITQMTDAGWKLINEGPSSAHKDSTILTFEEEDDNLPTPWKRHRAYTGTSCRIP
jgi:hypothetical protein